MADSDAFEPWPYEPPPEYEPWPVLSRKPAGFWEPWPFQARPGQES
jgi:hypothetical protein